METNLERAVNQYYKWSDVRRQHLTVTISLYLTISIGLIGFVFASIKDFPIDYSYIWLLRFGILALGFSIVFGLFLPYTRYRDFRATSNYFASNISETSTVNFKEKNEEIKKWENRTLNLFQYQTILMFIGILLLAIYFAYSRNIW